MNKRIFLTLFITIVIFIIICIVFTIISLNNNIGTGFSSSTNISKKQQNTSEVTKEENNNKDYYDIEKGSDVLQNIQDNYTLWMAIGIVSTIIFVIFYYFLTRKKEW